MFLDEARVAATLHHQNIVQVHDVGESAGEYFIAMEYLHGEDVRTLLSNASKSRAHVPLAIAIAVVSAAAAGLHYAHERRGADGRSLGIVHRDVSPSNILVGHDGSVKIVDFGIAKAAIREETRSGALKGKVSYMSPEQCTGAPLDRRSDVYALGVVLYELATTTRLFRGESDYRLMEQIVKGQVTLPRVRRPDLPDELSAIIMRALAADREQRYATADDLRVALERFATKTGALASTSTVAGYMRKQFGDRPEPWVELGGQFEDSFDDADDHRGRQHTPGSAGGSAPRHSWTELPRSQELFRSSSSIPMQTAPRVGDGSPHPEPAPAPRPIAARPGTPPNTSAELAWQQPPAAPPARRSGAARAAMIAAPVLLLAGVGVWKLTTAREPQATASLAASAAPAAPAPMVTPIPDAAPAPTASAAPEKIARAEEPTARTRNAGAAVKRAAQEPAPAARARTVERSEPPPSPERAAPPASAARLVPPAAAPAPAAPTPSAPSAPSAPLGPQPMVGPAAPPVAVVRAATPVAGPGSAGSAAPPAPAIAVAAPAPAPAAPSAAITTPALPSPSVPANAAPQNVAQTVLDANRIAGDKSISPDDTTQADIRRAGIAKVIGAYKLCLSADGSVDSVTQIKSTGFSAYDQKIQNTIRTKWRYRPFMVNGKPAPVCTAVRFIFSNG